MNADNDIRGWSGWRLCIWNGQWQWVRRCVYSDFFPNIQHLDHFYSLLLAKTNFLLISSTLLSFSFPDRFAFFCQISEDYPSCLIFKRGSNQLRKKSLSKKKRFFGPSSFDNRSPRAPRRACPTRVSWVSQPQPGWLWAETPLHLTHSLVSLVSVCVLNTKKKKKILSQWRTTVWQLSWSYPRTNRLNKNLRTRSKSGQTNLHESSATTASISSVVNKWLSVWKKSWPRPRWPRCRR